jgi:hypothetical protein
MNKIEVISKEEFSAKSWKKAENYSYAKGNLSSDISIGELKRALLNYPIGFVESPIGFQCNALLGVFEDQNLQVSETGLWIGGYIPNEIKGYPFSLIKQDTSSDEYIVCIKSDCDLVSENDEGLPFFLNDGSFAKEFQEIVDFLKLAKQDAMITENAVANLESANLLHPWDITLEVGEGVHRIQGMHKIDESRFYELKANELEGLRNTGALYIAYCQILSSQHLPTLIAAASKRSSNQAKSLLEDLSASNNDGTISFDNL